MKQHSYWGLLFQRTQMSGEYYLQKYRSKKCKIIGKTERWYNYSDTAT